MFPCKQLVFMSLYSNCPQSFLRFFEQTYLITRAINSPNKSKFLFEGDWPAVSVYLVVGSYWIKQQENPANSQCHFRPAARFLVWVPSWTGKVV